MRAFPDKWQDVMNMFQLCMQKLFGYLMLDLHPPQTIVFDCGRIYVDKRLLRWRLKTRDESTEFLLPANHSECKRRVPVGFGSRGPFGKLCRPTKNVKRPHPLETREPFGIIRSPTMPKTKRRPRRQAPVRRRRATRFQHGGVFPLLALAVAALVAAGKAAALGGVGAAAGFGVKKGLEAATRKRR